MTQFKSSLAASGLALAAALASVTMASAQDSGVYIRANAGLGVVNDANLSNGLTTDIGEALGDDENVEGESDIIGSLGLGYKFDDNWRVELDGDYLYNDLGAIAQTPSSFAKLRTQSLMANLIYDFDGLGVIEPFVGVGAGILRGEGSFSAHDFLIGDTLVQHPVCTGARRADTVYSCDVDDSDTAFAYQALAGIGVELSDRLTWDTHYTYMRANDLDFDGTRTAISQFADGSSVSGSGFNETNPIAVSLENTVIHSVMTGLRYNFGSERYVAPPPPPAPVETFTCFDGSVVTSRALCPTPPPPPPPPPAPTFTCSDGVTTVTDLALCPPDVEMMTCPDGVTMVSDMNACPRRSTETIETLCGTQNRQEIIYYEFNKGQSAETRNTINRILDIGQFCQVANIRVVGHTDTSGSAAYNLNLSKRRAADAREELVRQGVNPALITSEGKGETQPFVPTGDGVKEQLNRRTEVLITLSDVGAASFN